MKIIVLIIFIFFVAFSGCTDDGGIKEDSISSISPEHVLIENIYIGCPVQDSDFSVYTSS